jgi:hypothetical protein
VHLRTWHEHFGDWRIVRYKPSALAGSVESAELASVISLAVSTEEEEAGIVDIKREGRHQTQVTRPGFGPNTTSLLPPSCVNGI